MRKILIIGFVMMSVFLNAMPKISDYGRWEIPKNNALKVKHGENGFYIQKGRYQLAGNHAIEVSRGTLTLLQEEDGMMVEMRYFNLRGTEMWKRSFANVINLQVSDNGEYLVFADHRAVWSIKIRKNELIEHPKSDLYAINNKGDLLTVSNNIYAYNKEKKPVENAKEIGVIKNDFVLFAEHEILFLDKSKEKKVPLESQLYDGIILDKEIYYSTRKSTLKGNLFQCFQYDKEPKLVKEWLQTIPKLTSHDEIRTPLAYGNDTYSAKIGNSYAEIQNYGDAHYLHPGVDFLGDDFEPVYAVHNGYVKAVLTTGGDPYWRVAIANENTFETTEGYLYAHLNYDSITVQVGDYVEAGTQIGTLYPWGFADFTHIHFARIECQGETWTGDWITTDDPLSDMTNVVDTTIPIFNDFSETSVFAFRNGADNYLNANNLSGSFEVLVDCYDIANSTWKIDIRNIRYTLASVENPDLLLLDKMAYTYDFPLDVYTTNALSTLTMNTIYARDNTYNSLGNYETREYYHIITASDENPEITENDALQRINSTDFSNGDYILTVHIEDASGNQNQKSQTITFTNQNQAPNFVNVPDNIILENGVATLSCFELVEDDNTSDTLLIYDFEVSSDHLTYQFNETTGVLQLNTTYQGEVYALTITVEDQNQLSSSQVIEVRSATAVEGLANASILKVFPNPYSVRHHRAKLTIQFTTPIENHLVIDLYDIRGKKIKNITDENIPASRYEKQLSSALLSELGKGIYMVKVKTDKEIFSKKFILL